MVKPMLMALFIMLSIIWLMQSLRFMDFIINKGLDVGTFLWITALIIPSLLIVILPLAAFSGACFSFKRLNDDNELSSIFASGLSKWSIVNPALIMAAIVTVACYVLSLWLMPAGMATFKNLQHQIRQSGNNLLIEEATFNQIGKNITVYVKKRQGNSLKNILVHDTRKEGKPITWMAKEGKVVFTEGGYPRLVLVQGSRQQVSDEQLSVLEFKKHTIDITKKVLESDDRIKGREERYLGELLITKNISEREVKQFKAEFQKRLLWPLTPFPFIMLAAVVLIQTRRRRTGTFKATSFACLLAATYQGVLMMFHNIASKGNEAALYGQWLLPIAVVIICAIIITNVSSNKGEQNV